MRISYRQGLVSAQANFLQIGQTDTRYVDISVSPVPVVAAIAFGTVDYLIGEQRSVTNAWGPLAAGTHYLYWDVNQATGALTRGSTSLPPVTAASVPPAIVGQMWFDTVAKVMKEFTGTRWQPVLRVFAGVVNSGAILIPAQFESQVGLNEPCTAGFIMTDGLGKAFKNSQGQFLTTDTPISSIDTGSLVKLQGAQVVVQANENIPKFSLVYLVGGRAALASSDPSLDGSKAPLAMVTVDAYQNDAVTLVTSGQVVTNEQWDFPGTQIGKALYCSDSGVITTTKPLSWKNVKVGTIMSSNSVLLNFDQETEVPPKASGLENVGVAAPLTKTGAVEYPIIGMPRATISNDGFMDANDFARIPALETAVANKSNIGHAHVIADVTALQSTLDNKTDIGHSHDIVDVTNLPAALDGKSPVGHTHLKSDITDLAPTLNAINSAIAARIEKVSSPTTGNLVLLTFDGSLADAGVSSSAFSLVNHGHAIADVANLSQQLNDKSDIGHGHAITDVANLSTSLSSKSDIGHVHSISDVTLLQQSLDYKTNIGHKHALSADLTDVVVSSTVTSGDSLVYNSTLGIWESNTLTISNIANLSAALLLKSDIGHDHVIGDVDGLQIAIDGKADAIHTHPLTVHTHPISEIVNLQSTLDGKADLVHTHEISDTVGLQLAIAEKADFVHTHEISEVTALQATLDNKSDISHEHALDNLTDVNAGSPSDGDVLTYQNGEWIPAPGGSGGGSGGGGGTGAYPRMQMFSLSGGGGFSGQQTMFSLNSAISAVGGNFCSYDSYTGIFTFTTPDPLNSTYYKLNIMAMATPIDEFYSQVSWPSNDISKFGTIVVPGNGCYTFGMSQSQHFRYDGANSQMLQTGSKSFSTWTDSYFISVINGGQLQMALFAECYNNSNMGVSYEFTIEMQEISA